MTAIRLTAGAAVLYQALRRGWNVGISVPADLRRIDGEAGIITELRPGKATDLAHEPTGPWTGRDGAILMRAGLLLTHGKGGTYRPSDLVTLDPEIEIVGEDAFEPLLRHVEVETLWACRDGDAFELSFGWSTPDGGLLAPNLFGNRILVDLTMTPGQMRTVRRVIDGGPVDHVEIGDAIIAAYEDESVSIRIFRADAGIDLFLHGDDLAKLRAVFEDMTTDRAYEAGIGFRTPGGLYI